jgi:predicted LPLAT superfamily acyltransferase
VLAQRQPGLRLTILTHTAHAPRFNRLLAAHDPASQAGLLQVGEITAATAVLLEERVSRGEWVAVAGDRVPPGPAGRAVGAPFLGREAPFPVGPYILADLLRCPVMLLFCLRLADGYRLVLEPFADRLSLPRVGREALLGAAAARFAGRLEHHCRQAPLQWFNFFPFWDAPTGASGREPLAGARGSRHV